MTRKTWAEKIGPADHRSTGPINAGRQFRPANHAPNNAITPRPRKEATMFALGTGTGLTSEVNVWFEKI